MNDVLPSVLTEEQKQKKLTNLLQNMKREGLLDSYGKTGSTIWSLCKKNDSEPDNGK